MPANTPGARHTAVATKVCRHGQLVTEDGFVGSAFKTAQSDRWVKPADAANIAIGETFDIITTGTHEAPITGPLAAAAKGTTVFIVPATNVLATASATGSLYCGRVTKIDSAAGPTVAVINPAAPLPQA